MLNICSLWIIQILPIMEGIVEGSTNAAWKLQLKALPSTETAVERSTSAAKIYPLLKEQSKTAETWKARLNTAQILPRSSNLRLYPFHKVQLKEA